MTYPSLMESCFAAHIYYLLADLQNCLFILCALQSYSITTTRQWHFTWKILLTILSDYQLETFADAECEHRDTIHFHIEKWEQRSRLQRNFKFEKLTVSNEDLKLQEEKDLTQHIECAQGLQKRIYSNLLFRSGCIPVDVHNAQEEIQRVIHWDTIASEQTIKSLTKHSPDPEFDAQFIMALCNEKESTYITKPNLIRITGTSHNLCIFLDYLIFLLSTDADDYWSQHVSRAKKMEREAQISLLPIIITMLPMFGISAPKLLFHFNEEENQQFPVNICLKELVETYVAKDPQFKLYNLVHHNERVYYNGVAKRYYYKKKKFTTTNFVKSLLQHIGLDSVGFSLLNKKGAPDWGKSAGYRISIPSSCRYLSILTCIYDANHWGNYRSQSKKS